MINLLKFQYWNIYFMTQSSTFNLKIDTAFRNNLLLHLNNLNYGCFSVATCI